jgi:uncharacterized lipoprotein YmbA
MTRQQASRVVVVFLAAVALLLAGCAGVTDPTRYYVLSSTPATPGAATSSAAASSGVGVGVGPILVPAYLNRAQIVTRGASDEVDISTYHRWAEPLENGIAQALANDLATQIGSERIAVFPWRGRVVQTLDYQVTVVVLRFEGSPGRRVTLDARWRLVGRDGNELALKRTTIDEPVNGEGYQPLIHGMSRVLGALAREIAVEIRSRADTRASTTGR